MLNELHNTNNINWFNDIMWWAGLSSKKKNKTKQNMKSAFISPSLSAWARNSEIFWQLFGQWRSQPSLSGGAKWKDLPDFCLSFPLFPLFPDVPPLFPIFPSFSRFPPLFPDFWQFFSCQGGHSAPCRLRYCLRWTWRTLYFVKFRNF